MKVVVSTSTRIHTRSVEVGHSVGPLGTTKYYENKPATGSFTTTNPDKWKCRTCGNYVGSSRTDSSLEVTIQTKGNTRVMTINKGCCHDARQCKNPRLSEDLLAIWNESSGHNWKSRLESMWEVARRLDSNKLSVDEIQNPLPATIIRASLKPITYNRTDLSTPLNPFEKEEEIVKEEDNVQEEIIFKVRERASCCCIC